MPGKSIDELQLDDRIDPVPTTSRTSPTPSADDLRDERWYGFVQRIEDLLSDPKYNYASDTLRGIQETVERTKRVSDGQQRAVDNIEAGGDRQFGSQRRWGRRYEGR